MLVLYSQSAKPKGYKPAAETENGNNKIQSFS